MSRTFQVQMAMSDSPSALQTDSVGFPPSGFTPSTQMYLWNQGVSIFWSDWRACSSSFPTALHVDYRYYLKRSPRHANSWTVESLTDKIHAARHWRNSISINTISGEGNPLLLKWACAQTRKEESASRLVLALAISNEDLSGNNLEYITCEPLLNHQIMRMSSSPYFRFPLEALERQKRREQIQI